MDGQFYLDSRGPFLVTDGPSVSLATTYKAVLPAASLPALGSNYFGFVGKQVRIRIWGHLTTVATPGNMQAAIFWGSGADNTGTNLAASAAVALTANQSLMSFEWDILVKCRSIGATGSLLCHGMFNANVAVLSSTLQPVLIPASNASAVTVDLTANNVVSPQFLRSGSTAEAIMAHDMTWEALN
jgi:hypothetical protein